MVSRFATQLYRVAQRQCVARQRCRSSPVGKHFSCLVWLLAPFGLWLGLSFRLSAAAPPDAAASRSTPTAAQHEQFEKRVRPLLIESCGRCHLQGADSKGGLELRTRDLLLTGGDRGPAIVPGKPDESLLLSAVRHTADDDLKMPPDGRLTDPQIADLRTWIEQGAHWPTSSELVAGEPKRADKDHWSLQPLADPQPPAVQNAAWCQSEIDRFILARLEQAGLAPSPPADKHALVRRLYFDLIGLPPSVEEIETFVADEAPDAVSRLIDRLLASPHYGERWGRHWLDLVRYADTNGYEENTSKPYAFRYRDYVIEAFNQDVPYDQFVREHVAGDLLSEPRLSAVGSQLASPLGTAFFWFQEILDLAVDWPASLAEERENQIDVFGKCFLGLTIACARCHDHKFDPIGTVDYYALGGVLNSSTVEIGWIDSPASQAEILACRERMRDCQKRIDELLERARQQQSLIAQRRQAAQQMAAHLVAAREALARDLQPAAEDIASIAERHQLDPARLTRWIERLAPALERRDRIFRSWVKLARSSPAVFDYRRQALAEQFLVTRRVMVQDASHRRLLADFEGADFAGWRPAGPAFGDAPCQGGPLTPNGYSGRGFASSGQAGDSLTGRLLSPRFRVDKPFLILAFRVAGGTDLRKTYVNVVVHSQVMGQSDSFRAAGTGGDSFENRYVVLAPPFAGRDVCIELVDESTEPGGHLLADNFMLIEVDPDTLLEHNDPTDPGINQVVLDLLCDRRASTDEALAQAYQNAVLETLDAWSRTPGWQEDEDRRELLAWALADDSPLADSDAAAHLSASDRAELDRLRGELQDLEKTCPASNYALVTTEATAENLHVQKRGSPYSLGPEVSRGYVGVLCGERPAIAQGSGRRELAEWISAAENPLTPRVIVNRVWQHHFGRGLVATPDNFGLQGERPTHPELLDYLTRRFLESGWSIKALHRMLLSTSTYLQSSVAVPAAHEIDPDNRLWHRMPAQRLEAECVRDSLLALGGNLDRTLYGPSVPTTLRSARPDDGDPAIEELPGPQRRTLYLEVRRGVISRFLTLFDFPVSDNCVGLRSTASVPLQSLNLLNDPFVVAQARSWAERIVGIDVPEVDRIERVFLEGLGRPATPDERAAANRFLGDQAARYRANGVDEATARADAWVDFCHLALNLGEFLYVR